MINPVWHYDTEGGKRSSESEGQVNGICEDQFWQKIQFLKLHS